MKIEKEKFKNWVYYYYRDSKTKIKTPHGLYNDYSWWGISYNYHNQEKGVCLRNKYKL